MTGFEPATSRATTERSTNWATNTINAESGLSNVPLLFFCLWKQSPMVSRFAWHPPVIPAFHLAGVTLLFMGTRILKQYNLRQELHLRFLWQEMFCTAHFCQNVTLKLQRHIVQYCVRAHVLTLRLDVNRVGELYSIFSLEICKNHLVPPAGLEPTTKGIQQFIPLYCKALPTELSLPYVARWLIV